MISFVNQLRRLAAEKPDSVAITCQDESITRAQLLERGGDLAVHLRSLGVTTGDLVTVALPNSIDWFVSYVAIWLLGATPQPVSSRLPQRELEALIELADPPVVIGAPEGTVTGRHAIPVGFRAPRADASGLPDVISPAWKAPTSGGSTGRPKLIVSGDPAAMDETAPPPLMMDPGGCLVMPGPLYHNGPAVWSWQALLNGLSVALMPRFDAEGTLSEIERHRGSVLYMVPTMMKRIWRLPEDVRGRYDLSSLRIVWHLAEPCPEWLKQCWIDWLGAERIMELYAGTEAQTATVITGAEWLAHRGSVGRVQPGSILITDEDGNEVPVGEMGEVWMRSLRGTPTYRYVGATARTREGGWESLGDMGRLDADGYLYLGDRASDMILSGGANIYPAEVEAAIQEHPAVQSCAVIGLPDEDKGAVIHAIIEATRSAVSEDELRTFLAERLVTYKIPRTFEYVDFALRGDDGKVRRSALRAERVKE
ncbi:MAG: acid--CoA ligase [Actinobacteria bacterium]|jgi:bile acid-coenzyme A ligase|nr:acid--CoA ligase [Actinomycetota bacterium]NBR65914.1 acid--CoA ligase [Actinomycetota bacterium]NBU15763.1 acid--CoA ligase [Actinomycetota bacterium]